MNSLILKSITISDLWGVPKPSMRAFEMLNLLAETEAEATLSSNVSAATAGPG